MKLDSDRSIMELMKLEFQGSQYRRGLRSYFILHSLKSLGLLYLESNINIIQYKIIVKMKKYQRCEPYYNSSSFRAPKI